MRVNPLRRSSAERPKLTVRRYVDMLGRKTSLITFIHLTIRRFDVLRELLNIEKRGRETIIGDFASDNIQFVGFFRQVNCKLFIPFGRCSDQFWSSIAFNKLAATLPANVPPALVNTGSQPIAHRSPLCAHCREVCQEKDRQARGAPSDPEVIFAWRISILRDQRA